MTHTITIEGIRKFCERFAEHKKWYEPGPYNFIVFINDKGDLDGHLTASQWHGCPVIIGELSREDIIQYLIKEFTKRNKMKIYSQNNEQEIIIAHFMGKTDGTFLDLGANDGITLSNTRALFERGWKGVLVDASPKAFPRLKENYRGKEGITLYHLALTSKSGKIQLHDSGNLIGADDVGLVSTIHQHEVDRFKSIVRYEDVDVPCFTWEEFIQASPIKEFDFVSMDIEGCELDVLPHMDLSKTSMVCIEWNCKEDVKAEYDRILKDFHIIHTNQENLIYVR